MGTLAEEEELLAKAEVERAARRLATSIRRI